MAENPVPTNPATPEPVSVEIKATWRSADLDPILVDHLHLQHIADCYYLVFGQSRFPLLLGNVSQGVEAEIKPVVRLALTAESFAKFKALFERSK